MKKVQIYTDGACSGNPGPGGWGAILLFGEARRELSGGEDETTNNRMEMTAVIMGLEQLKQPCEVELYSDSTYVLKGISEWLPGWKARGWKTADKKPVKNADLWQRLEKAASVHKMHWHWVRGHNGHDLNEQADQLAGKGLRDHQSRDKSA